MDGAYSDVGPSLARSDIRSKLLSELLLLDGSSQPREDGDGGRRIEIGFSTSVLNEAGLPERRTSSIPKPSVSGIGKVMAGGSLTSSSGIVARKLGRMLLWRTIGGEVDRVALGSATPS